MSMRYQRVAIVMIFAVAFGGILVFVLSIGPTGERVECRRSTEACEVVETYFFGLARTRRLVFPLDTITGARIKPVSPGVGARTHPPETLELVFRDGTSYPTIDFGYRSWAEKKVTALNDFLRDPTRRELILTDDTLGFLLVQRGIPGLVIIATALVAVRLRARRKPDLRTR